MKILYANTIDYNFGLQQRPHHIMNLLAKRGHEIYWVNNTRNENKRPDRYDNITVYHNWDVFCKRFKDKIDVLFCSWSRRHIDKDMINPKITIFDNVDNFTDWQDTDNIMCEKSDIILCTSILLLQEKLKLYPNKNVALVPNACWAEKNKIEINEPEDLKNIPHPRILFSGAMAYWCDLDIIQEVARQYNLVFVGKPWGIKEIPPEAIYLGEKSYEELQGYYKYCDINILPFKRCQIADYSNPIKMYESSVFGIPTVATDIPDALGYEPCIITSKNKAQFLLNINLALKNNNLKNQDLCKKFAKNNDWNIRVDTIEQEIEKVLKKGVLLDEDRD